MKLEDNLLEYHRMCNNKDNCRINRLNDSLIKVCLNDALYCESVPKFCIKDLCIFEVI